MSVKIIGIEERYGTQTAFFSISLPDRHPVFMSVKVTPYENENRGVVIVDAKKFLELWRATSHLTHQKQAQGNPETWRDDRKFKSAVDGFSRGISNPVPLADVVYSEAEEKSVSYKYLWFGRQEHIRHCRRLAFINGITRTIWLLSHGCKAFPVKCGMPDAIALHCAASLEGTRLFTLRDVEQGEVYI